MGLRQVINRCLVGSVLGGAVGVAGMSAWQAHQDAKKADSQSVRACAGTVNDFNGDWKAYFDHCAKSSAKPVPKGSIAKGANII